MLEEIEDFEKQTLTHIVYNMIMWFGFDDVQIHFTSRPEVASRLWVDIEIKKDNSRWSVSGQRNDIVRRRLIDWLTKNIENYRDNQQ